MERVRATLVMKKSEIATLEQDGAGARPTTIAQTPFFASDP
jgi:hypothetical protein